MSIRINKEGIRVSVRLGHVSPKIEPATVGEPIVTEREAPADVQTIVPSYDAIAGKYRGMTLNDWLKQNYAEGLKETKDAIVILTGRDFETNMPKFELIPRSYYAGRQKRSKVPKDGDRCSDAGLANPAYRESTGYTGPVIVPPYTGLADELMENGKLFIDKNQRLAGKLIGARGNVIAKNLKHMLTMYLHANGIEYDVRIDFRNDGAMLTIDTKAHVAYKALRQRDAGRRY